MFAWQGPPAVPRRRFRSLGFLVAWAQDQIGGSLTAQHPWPSRLPTKEAIERVVIAVWRDGRARGRQERDHELVVALGLGVPDPDDHVVPHDPDGDVGRDLASPPASPPISLDPSRAALVESSRTTPDTSTPRRRPRNGR